MKTTPILALSILVAFSCSTKKTETATDGVDTTTVDTVLATTPAPALLAFAGVDGFSANKSLALPDSVNYFHLESQEGITQLFNRADNSAAPDFIINYIIAVATSPDKRVTTIAMDKVVTSESSIDVYLNIVRGAAGATKTSAVQLFAIERREGYPVMQFYVNGVKDKAIVLVENQ